MGYLNPALNNLAQRVTGSTPVGGTQNVFFRDACVAESKKISMRYLLRVFLIKILDPWAGTLKFTVSEK